MICFALRMAGSSSTGTSFHRSYPATNGGTRTVHSEASIGKTSFAVNHRFLWEFPRCLQIGFRRSVVFDPDLVASSPALGTYAQPEVPYPTQLVRIVVPFSAGSTSDLLARTISDRLSTRWQQQIIVENRPGIAGTASVAKAQPDGYTIIMASNGHAILDRISVITFDPIKDFVGISGVGTLPLVLVVPPNSPATSLLDFIDLARCSRQNELCLRWVGSTTYMAGELLKRIAKIDVLQVPLSRRA